MDRRQWLAAAAAGAWGWASPAAAQADARTAAGSAVASASDSAAVDLRVPAPVAQLHVDPDGTLLAVTRTGELWRATAAAWQKLGDGLDPAAPVATGHGRVAGRSAAGGLWVWQARSGGRVRVLDGAVLAPHAGLLVLASGIVAVTAGSDGVHRLVRFDPDGSAWAESARSRSAVLPDARPLQFDPDGNSSGPAADDDGHVVVFGAPNDDRYRHGVLGDAIEPTALLLLERHGLAPLAQIELPPPHVFEDIAPRPIAWRGRRALLTVRAGPQGAQLCVVAPSGQAGAAGRLELAALGDAIGMPNRWLSPSTDGRRLLTVVTPHIGGVLHRHVPQGARLPGEPIARGLSNHTIGQRDLDVSAWVGSRWVVPAQDRRQLLVVDVDAATPVPAPQAIALPAPVRGLKAWPRGAQTGVAVLLQDGSAWWLRIVA